MRSFILTVSLLTALLHLQTATAAPISKTLVLRDEVSNAYSGAGGNAMGGSVNGANGVGEGLIDLFSHNAGNGGDATSGISKAGKAAIVSSTTSSSNGGSDSGSNTSGSSTSGDTPGSNGTPNTNVDASTPNSNEVGNAYSGAGGSAQGGSVTGPSGSLINLFSGNAGNGGNAMSGSSHGRKA